MHPVLSGTRSEEVLGCPAEEAGRHLGAVMAQPPQALRAALAVWTRPSDMSEALSAWERLLPETVQFGPIPSQATADAWALRETAGLIKRFPVALNELHADRAGVGARDEGVVGEPFEVAPAAERLAHDSPWQGRVGRVLWDLRPAWRADRLARVPQDSSPSTSPSPSSP